MPISKLAEELVKLAIPRWREVFQYLNEENQRILQKSGLVKSDRTNLLGKLRGNKNRRERLGYLVGDIEQVPQNQLAMHIADIDNRMLNESGTELIRDMAVRDALTGFNGKNPNKPKRTKSSWNPRSWEMAATDPFTKTIFVKNSDIPKMGKNKHRRMFQALIGEHELFEAQACEKIIDNYLKGHPDLGWESALSRNDLIRALKSEKYPGTMLSNIGHRMGSHISMDVLSKERRVMDTFVNTKSPAYKKICKMREKEYAYMDAAGKFDPAKAVQPGQPIDTFKNHEKIMGKNLQSPVNVGGEWWVTSRK